MASLARLNVTYRGWGESWPLGTLAQAGDQVLFEYSPQAIERGLQFSPLRVPLPRPGAAPMAYSGPRHFHGLPGFIADSLPDGWGMLLMDRALRKSRRDPRSVSMLERLAIVGQSAIGALGFEPADPLAAEQPGALDVKALAREIQAVVSDGDERSSAEQLRHLLMLGGS
ncbi:MAG: HipA N-terminal domain-containing protein, partial [Acidovorax sp.]|uniref:HipA N-terminal domain-containing protein n=1 Tax=Acidovorax sp. TaxID=1872122 RepID=UPI0039E22F2F